MQPTSIAKRIEATGTLPLAACQEVHRRKSTHAQPKEAKGALQEKLTVPTNWVAAGSLVDHLNDGAIANQLETAEVDGSSLSAENCMPVVDPSIVLALGYPDGCQLQRKHIEGGVRGEPEEIKSAVNDAIVELRLLLFFLDDLIPAAKLRCNQE